MYQDVIIAGFGGQGVMLIGDILANAAMQADYKVTYMPVYGVEMRGGTANCTVVIADEEIGSPIIHAPMSLIVMNRPSLDKFQPRLKPGGLQIVNASTVPADLVHAASCEAHLVPVNDLANDLGNPKMANVVALGAWLQATGALPLEDAADVLAATFARKSSRLGEMNRRAFLAGATWVRENATEGLAARAAS